MSLSLLKPNPGKRLTIKAYGQWYARHPIKTHLVAKGDHLLALIKEYMGDYAKQADVLVISERIVAITQGRSFFLKDIRPSFWARFLSFFVSRHPGGIGLKSPWTMQLAIQEAGLPRLILAGLISGLTRPLGVKGLFYRLAGHQINAIDGPCAYTLPPGNQSAKLGPKEPMKVAQDLAKQLGVKIAIIDANDYGVSVLGYSVGVSKKLVEQIFRDNPLGQAREQTPLVLVRKVNQGFWLIFFFFIRWWFSQ